MDPTSNERPPPHEKKRARKEEAESNSLRHATTVRQSARMWIGSAWIVLIFNEEQGDDRGVCVKYKCDAWRTMDPDVAVAAYRAALMHCSAINVRITPEGRARGDGIELAYKLIKRDIAVSLAPLDEHTARSCAHELEWADNNGLTPLDKICTRFPAWVDR
jgi:hypothetical protein